jgi:hypothetical protein
MVALENRYTSCAMLGIEPRWLCCPTLSYPIPATEFPLVSCISIKMGYNFCK